MAIIKKSNGFPRNFQVKSSEGFDLYLGGAQGVMIDPSTGTLYGGADPRREGFVMGD